MWAFLVLVVPIVTMADNTIHVRTNYKPYEDTWQAFKETYGRSYSKEEESVRYKVFLDRVQTFERHNQDFVEGKVSFTKDINEFADELDDEEGQHSCHVDEDEENLGWITRHKRQTGFCRPFTPPTGFVPPQTVDWRNKGIIAPVRHQGQCGSCYAFGVATTIAAQLKHKFGGQLIPMSEQQLVDCRQKSCKGSDAETSFRYIYNAGGIMSSKDYPYREKTKTDGKPGNCAFSTKKISAKVCGCLYSSGELTLQKMVANKGPVYVSIAVVESFQEYSSGIFSVTDCTSIIRHCVTVIGYGYDGKLKKNYWIIQNSWGTGWGEGGYGKIERGKNICGIGSKVTVPQVLPADGNCNRASGDGSGSGSDGSGIDGSVSDLGMRIGLPIGIYITTAVVSTLAVYV